MKRSLRSLVGLMALATVTSASAVTVVSTYGTTTPVSRGLGMGWNDYAAGFVWNSDLPFLSADLWLEKVGTPGNLSVSLYSDISGKPGTALYVLSAPSNPSVAGSYTYTAPQAVPLQYGSHYWLVASEGSYGDLSNQYVWYVGTPGDSNYVSTTWRRLSGTPAVGDWYFVSKVLIPPAFQVNAVPEPSTYAMLLLGLGVLAWAKRRAVQTEIPNPETC